MTAQRTASTRSSKLVKALQRRKLLVENDADVVSSQIVALIATRKFDPRSRSYVRAALRKHPASALVQLRVMDYRWVTMNHEEFALARPGKRSPSPVRDRTARASAFRALERGYQQAVLLDPKLAEAWQQLAAVLDVQNRIDEAAKVAKVAVRLDPNPSALGLLARIRAQQGYRTEARALARRIRRSSSPYAKDAATEVLRGSWDPDPDSNPVEYRRMIRDLARERRTKMKPLK